MGTLFFRSGIVEENEQGNPASAKLPRALKRDALVEPARKSPNAASNFYVHSRVVLAGLVLSGKSRPSSLSFLSGIVERNE